MTFENGPKILVRQATEEDWTLEEEVVYQGRVDRFVVPKGTVTDFASVPRVFAWLVPSYWVFTAAAVLHDHLVRVERPAGRISAVDADGLFRRAMRELGVPFLVRWFMWAAVRLGSLTDADGRPLDGFLDRKRLIDGDPLQARRRRALHLPLCPSALLPRPLWLLLAVSAGLTLHNYARCRRPSFTRWRRRASSCPSSRRARSSGWRASRPTVRATTCCWSGRPPSS